MAAGQPITRVWWARLVHAEPIKAARNHEHLSHKPTPHLRHLGVQALPHLHTTMGDQHTAVQVHVHQCTGLQGIQLKACIVSTYLWALPSGGAHQGMWLAQRLRAERCCEVQAAARAQVGAAFSAAAVSCQPKVPQRAHLVEELGGEGDAELGGGDGQAALAPPALRVECLHLRRVVG